MKTEDLIHSYCQVIGTGDDGSSPCLIVSVEKAPRYSGGEPTENKILRRYLFNVGEGTQRFCGEAGVKLAKVNKLFLTGTGAEEHAGLSGLILTLSALGSPALEVFGPTGVDTLVAGLQAFGPRVGRCPAVSPMPLPLGPGESQCSYVLGDEHMEVRCGVVDPARSQSSKKVVTVDSSSRESSSSSSSDEESSSEESSSEESSSGDDDNDSSNDESGGEGHREKVKEQGGKQKHDRSDGGSRGGGDDIVSNKRRADGADSLTPAPRGENKATANGDGAIANPGAGHPKGARADRHPEIPAGIPARGPAVLYRCRVLHGEGSTFLVLSCPNVAYVPAVRDHAIVRGARGKDSVLFVFHLSPEDVVDSAAYAPLLALKGTHVLLGCGREGRRRGAGGLQHRKLAERSVQLNFVAPQAFPLHSALVNTAGHDGADSVSSCEEIGTGGSRTVVGHTLTKAMLLPVAARGINLSAVRPPVEVAEIWEDMEQRVEEAGLRDERDVVVARLWRAHGLMRKSGPPSGLTRESGLPNECLNLGGEDGDEEDYDADATMRNEPGASGSGSGGGLGGAEVFFLGTGSAAPTKNRGCSGILVRIPQAGLVGHNGLAAEGAPLRLLIDAGEGTLGHFERQFGREGALREIRGLDCVWISHKHADHHTGLFRLIAEHHRARQASRPAGGGPREAAAPLVVVAPSAVLTFVKACKEFSGEDISYQAMRCKDLERAWHWRGGSGTRAGPSPSGRRGSRRGVSALLSGMRSVSVIHCREAYGLVVQLWEDGAKLVYSGDTRPCDRLVRAGTGAALLIHEATFDDSMQQDAVSKFHCTTSEALEVGRRMRAGEVVLTHFSQRYPRVPVLDTERAQHFCVAFDGMVLNGNTVGVLPAAANLLSQVLEPKAEDGDDGKEEIVPS
ncbi:conserved unknown protein [Ectocarpus siliculosus]|uniref:ribonuclease Z n=1 Tax=Ectocarpus siliculosus TaxID=2880 RepID=D7FS74_ECTSI|nr:conserved unknown protein [Ectocarpus siliculosus]|eukprot:CBJ31015.1 conserved unknown protein [Ectocarpus siliculosus]